ncbi:galanin peptides isoform 2-T3 [Lycaon pictus]
MGHYLQGDVEAICGGDKGSLQGDGGGSPAGLGVSPPPPPLHRCSGPGCGAGAPAGRATITPALLGAAGARGAGVELRDAGGSRTHRINSGGRRGRGHVEGAQPPRLCPGDPRPRHAVSPPARPDPRPDARTRRRRPDPPRPRDPPAAPDPPPLKMPGGCALLLAWLLLAAALSATPGLGAPEKRGWTLNSAGYLLGPHAIDNHRSFHEKPGLTGKRELPPEDEGRSGGFAGPLSENAAVRMLIEFLTFLRLKEAGALPDLPDLPSAVSAEDMEQP